MSLAQKHQEHYRSCGCLDDSSECCLNTCECHQKAEPAPDTETLHDVEVIIRVRTFGYKEKATESVLRTLSQFVDLAWHKADVLFDGNRVVRVHPSDFLDSLWDQDDVVVVPDPTVNE